MNSLPIRRNGKSTFEGLAFSASVAQTLVRDSRKAKRHVFACFSRVF